MWKENKIVMEFERLTADGRLWAVKYDGDKTNVFDEVFQSGQMWSGSNLFSIQILLIWTSISILRILMRLYLIQLLNGYYCGRKNSKTKFYL